MLSWRQDQNILGRMRAGWDLMCQGLTRAEIGFRLGISVETVSQDRANMQELFAEERDANADVVRASVEEHITNLRQLWTKVHEMLTSTDRKSLNRGALVGQLRAIEMDIAKLDGSLVERKEVKGDLEGVTFTLNIKPPNT